MAHNGSGSPVEVGGHTEENDVDLLRRHLDGRVGADPVAWGAWPGGWPGDIEAALIDAVFSARAVYRSRHGHGVHSLVVRWREARPLRRPALDELVQEIAGVGVPAWADTFGSRQVSPGRRESAPGGRMKAATVLEAARALIAHGVHTADEVTPAVKAVLRSVPGVGVATANYFLMLLGVPGVKPDRMVLRFVGHALGRKVGTSDAERLVSLLAKQLGTEPHLLDHAIWRFESDRAARSSAPTGHHEPDPG